MSKRFLRDLEEQQRNLEQEIYIQVKKVNLLDSSDDGQLSLNDAEILGAKENYRNIVSTLVIKKEKHEFWIDLLRKQQGKIFDASLNINYPLFITKIIHRN